MKFFFRRVVVLGQAEKVYERYENLLVSAAEVLVKPDRIWTLIRLERTRSDLKRLGQT